MLLDPNPRAIKRLVNAYSFRSGFALSAGQTHVIEKLPYWCVLDLRFPYSAERLAARPDLVDFTMPGKPTANRPKRTRARYRRHQHRHFPERRSRAEIEKILAHLTPDDIRAASGSTAEECPLAHKRPSDPIKAGAERRHERPEMLDLTYETPKPKVIAGATGDWELVIGLEVHAQVASKAKLFSGASTQFGAEPNSNVAFVDAAMPGMLPCHQRILRRPSGAHRPWPQGRNQQGLAPSTARTISTPTCPRAIRSASFTTPSWAKAKCWSTWARVSPAACASNASTLNRTRANPSTTWTRICPSSISTAPAWPLWKSSRGPTSAAPKKPPPMSANCARSCATSAPATATCKTATSAPTSTSASAARATTRNTRKPRISPTSAPVARSRT